MLNLKCDTCGIEYEKPDDYKKFNDTHKNIFYTMNLTYCDKCRREKEIEYLKELPNVVKALSELK